MTLTELIEKIDRYYPDGLILDYFDREKEEVAEGLGGDSLAYSIVSNICGTYDTDLTNEEQLAAARETLEDMARELRHIIDNI